MTARDTKAVHKAMGSELRRARLNKGLPQGPVARAIGVERATLNNKEAARQGVSITQFLDWCDFLGVDPAQIIAKVAERTRP